MHPLSPFDLQITSMPSDRRYGNKLVELLILPVWPMNHNLTWPPIWSKHINDIVYSRCRRDRNREAVTVTIPQQPTPLAHNINREAVLWGWAAVWGSLAWVAPSRIPGTYRGVWTAVARAVDGIVFASAETPFSGRVDVSAIGGQGRGWWAAVTPRIHWLWWCSAVVTVGIGEWKPAARGSVFVSFSVRLSGAQSRACRPGEMAHGEFSGGGLSVKREACDGVSADYFTAVWNSSMPFGSDIK